MPIHFKRKLLDAVSVRQSSIKPFNEKNSAVIFAALKANYVQYKNKNKGAFDGGT